MVKRILFLLLTLCLCGHSHAAQWVRLGDNGSSKLMLDKQSIAQQDNFKKAWVKVEYKKPQINPDTLDTQYNTAKLLWFFDCPAQKSATSQVFQYFNHALVYSAGVEAKNAEFIEPVPESDVDVAMRYVCLGSHTRAETAKPSVEKSAETKTSDTKSNNEKPNDEKLAEAQPSEKAPEKALEKTPAQTAEKEDTKPTSTSKTAPEKAKPSKTGAQQTRWAYTGKEGPENWGKLDAEFAACDTGRNQSPINIENTLHAAAKPIRGIQKFAAKEIVNFGHTVQINFKTGNMLVLDSTPYQMKQVNFHAPSENTINGKSFPLEAHFVHTDTKGNITVVAVMFKEGSANTGLEKLWAQLPSKESAPIALKSRVIANELMPENRSYYRFSGSLTTPPCTEGVRWIVFKTPMTASKAQIAAFENAIKHPNNRPVQALNGRVVVE